MDRFQQLQLMLHSRCPDLELREYESMARHTTFRLGGPVRLMALPKTEQEAICAVKTAAELDLIPFFLGNGSNLLVPDEGVQRFVLAAADGLSSCRIDEETQIITAGSGISLSKLACFALEQNRSGLEFAYGIPGSLGGAVTMNAGAYGGEMAQVITAVEYLTLTGESVQIPSSACEFSYRHSCFSDGNRFILSAELGLHEGDQDEIKAQMHQLMERRRKKQPLEYPSGGSMFKRPQGHFAAALIDQCGLKGFSVGGAQISEKHAGFVINRGGATCADVLSLVEQVQTLVLSRTGIALEMEVRMLEPQET